jgi:SAM-dependent methyltransferase
MTILRALHSKTSQGKLLVNRNTIVRLAPELRITLNGNGVLFESKHDAIQCDRDIVAALARLQGSCSIGALLEELPAPSKQDWITGSAQILDLIGAGVLIAGAERTQAPLPDHGFGYLEPHIGMIVDHARTRLFLDAIRRTVRPGDIVLDLGTGTGLLAIAAAKAGAQRVYAVERTAIADVASRMFERNGVADRITLIRDNSTAICLPEQAQVLTSEVLGTDPLSERILESTADAVQRLLVPGARLIPKRLRILARAVQLPKAVIDRHVVDHVAAERWAAAYEIDFSALCETSLGRALSFTVQTQEAAHWTSLTPATELLTIDLAHCPALPVQVSQAATITTAGTLSGMIVFWEIELDSKARLSTDPICCGSDCSWGTAVWMMTDRPYVREEQDVRMTLRYSAMRCMAEVRLAEPA